MKRSRARALLLLAIVAVSLPIDPMQAAETTRRTKPSTEQGVEPVTKKPGVSEMKWTPLPDPWVACDINGMKCRCSGDVVDCRAATGGNKATVKSQ